MSITAWLKNENIKKFVICYIEFKIGRIKNEKCNS